MLGYRELCNKHLSKYLWAIQHPNWENLVACSCSYKKYHKPYQGMYSKQSYEMKEVQDIEQ